MLESRLKLGQKTAHGLTLRSKRCCILIRMRSHAKIKEDIIKDEKERKASVNQGEKTEGNII